MPLIRHAGLRLFPAIATVFFTWYLSAFAAGVENYYGKFYAEGPLSKPAFALTYDDGPGYITEDLLKLLDKYAVKATFFMNGSSVRSYPARAAKVAAAGHLLGNHTDQHKNYFKVGKSLAREKVLEDELDKAEKAIFKTGARPVFLRMPNGYIRDWVKKIAAKKGYILVNWTYGSDWSGASEEKMAEEYLKNLRPGAIFLMHDGGGKNRAKTLRLTEKILIEARKKGLQALTLDKLLGIPEARP